MRLLNNLLNKSTFASIIYKKSANLTVSFDISENSYFISNELSWDVISNYYPAPFFNLGNVVQDHLKSNFKNLKI